MKKSTKFDSAMALLDLYLNRHLRQIGRSTKGTIQARKLSDLFKIIKGVYNTARFMNQRIGISTAGSAAVEADDAVK